MTYESDIVWGKRVITPRIRNKRYYDSVKSKGKALGNTLNKNIKFMGSQVKKAGVKLTTKPKVINQKVKKIKYYKRKGKKYYPVYKKYKKPKIKNKNSGYSNPMGISW